MVKDMTLAPLKIISSSSNPHFGKKKRKKAKHQPQRIKENKQKYQQWFGRWNIPNHG